MTELVEKLAVLVMTVFVLLSVVLVLLWIGPLPFWAKAGVTLACAAILGGTIGMLRVPR